MLFEKAPDAYYLNDLKGTFIDGNEVAVRLTGYAREKLVGKSFLKLKLLSPNQIAKASTLLARNALGKDTGPDEFILTRKDGKQVPVEIRTHPVKIQGKRVVLGLARDITERKRAKEALRERVKELGCLYAISELIEKPGISLEEILQGAVDLIPTAWQYPEIACARIIVDGKEFETENFGETIWKQASNILLHGERIGTIEVCYLEERDERDEGPFLKEERSLLNIVTKRLGHIIERKQEEAELQHLTQVLGAIRNVNQLIIREKDRDKLLKGVCDNLVETRGYSNAWITLLDESGKLVTHAESGLGKDFLSMVERLERGQLSTCMQRALKQSEPVVTEDPGSTCTDCPLSANSAGRSAAIARLEYEGKVYGLLSVSVSRETATDVEELGLFHEVATDIAFAVHNIELEEQRKGSEETLKEYSERLEVMVEERTKELNDAQEELVRKEKLASLGQLAGGVGHDLRNPLGAIKNAAYFLNMVLEAPEPEVKETLEILEKEVGTTERIISSLLEFGPAKAPTQRKMSVNEILQETLSRITVPENVEVVQELDQTLPKILADPNQLGQVFGNVILNGIQAMTEGGQLTIKSEALALGRVSVSITYTGVGIPEEQLEKLFEPLYTTKAKGIGLGLAIVKTLVEGHGGTIEVDSDPGKGSTFTVKLPTGIEES